MRSKAAGFSYPRGHCNHRTSCITTVADPHPSRYPAEREDKRGLFQKLVEFIKPGPDSTDELIETLAEAEDKDVILEPVEQPELQFRALLELYWEGSRRLLHFFPKSALAYVERFRKEQDADKALRAARGAWEGDEFRQGFAERDDPYYRLAYRDTDPLDAEFAALAAAVFEPLFAHVRQEAEG